MSKMLVAALAAAFAVCTVIPVGAATYGSTTPPSTHKSQTLSHQDCVKQRMGKSKSSAAMKRAETWCTAHQNMKAKKKSTAASTY